MLAKSIPIELSWFCACVHTCLLGHYFSTLPGLFGSPWVVVALSLLRLRVSMLAPLRNEVVELKIFWESPPVSRCLNLFGNLFGIERSWGCSCARTCIWIANMHIQLCIVHNDGFKMSTVLLKNDHDLLPQCNSHKTSNCKNTTHKLCVWCA